MKVVILNACIEWRTRHDEKGQPICNQIGVLVSWMPFEISYNKCMFCLFFSGEYANLMRREPQRIEMISDYIVKKFVEEARKLFEKNQTEPSDMTEACKVLRREITDGFRNFIKNDKKWIHLVNDVLGVPKGSLYRAENGEWYEAEKDAMIVVHSGAGDQMMTQAEYRKRISYKLTIKK